MAQQQPLIKDAQLNAALQEDGYIIVPFLTPEQVQQLTTFYWDTHPAVDKGLFASIRADSNEVRLNTINYLREMLSPVAAAFFNNCTPLGGTFIVKAPGQEGMLHPHEDWNIVDENITTSLNVWIPLIDTYPDNGGISVLKGSHNLVKTYRGPGITPVFEGIAPHLWQYMDKLSIKAGHALIYYHNLLHASGINKTDRLRVAAVFALIPQQAELMYYCKSGDGIEAFECNEEFYWKNNPTQGPAGLKSRGHIAYNLPAVSESLFDKMYRKGVNYDQALAMEKEVPAGNPPAQQGWLKKVAAFFRGK